MKRTFKNFDLDAMLSVDPQTRAPKGPLAVIIAAQLNMEAASHLRTMRRALIGPYQDYLALRDGLVAKYGKDGRVSQQDCDDWPGFVAEYTQLLEQTHEIDIVPIKLSALYARERTAGKVENVSIDISAEHQDLLIMLGVLVDEADQPRAVEASA